MEYKVARSAVGNFAKYRNPVVLKKCRQYVGAGVVASFGFYTMFLKTRRAAEASETDKINFRNVQTPSRLSVYLRGLTLNFFNPVI